MDAFNSTAGLEGESSSIVPIVVAVIVSLVVAATVTGNLLVILAFFTTRRLRTYNNHFILGLAIADFFVGAIGMPMFGVVFILGRWPFGAIFCDIFSYCDHAFSHISVVSVMIISLDRFVATVYPLHHRSHWRSRSQALLLVSIAFLVPLITWAPPTIFWSHVHIGSENNTFSESEDCLPDYLVSDFFSILSPVLFFWIPFTITTLFYIKIYSVIHAVVVRKGNNWTMRNLTRRRRFQTKDSNLPRKHSLDHAELSVIMPSVFSSREVNGKENESESKTECPSEQYCKQSSFLLPLDYKCSNFAFVNSAFEPDTQDNLTQNALGRRLWVSEQSMNTVSYEADAYSHRVTHKSRSHSASSVFDSFRNERSSSWTVELASSKTDANTCYTCNGNVCSSFYTKSNTPKQLFDRPSDIQSRSTPLDINKVSKSWIDLASDKSYFSHSFDNMSYSNSIGNVGPSNQVIITKSLSPGGAYVTVGRTNVMVRKTPCIFIKDYRNQGYIDNSEITRSGELVTTCSKPQETNCVNNLRDTTGNGFIQSRKALQGECFVNGRKSKVKTNYTSKNSDKIDDFVEEGSLIIDPQPSTEPQSLSGNSGIWCGDDSQQDVPLEDIDDVPQLIKSTVTDRRLKHQNTKGIRTLGLIIVAMFITWAPWAVIVIILSLCEDCIPEILYSVTVFLGYMNSTANPICYALSDPKFKQAFRRLLRLECRRSKSASSTADHSMTSF
ncbi:muscarinic acetylcholine receptor M2-like [Lytechinus variegatus]|uniref:muscarinic acetylcholine receptor M2-like n=1 Tax=Lytechinus variegatus TaxID=7654 RepID=UPI001BB2079B|nr:muscarinic acetylcholine receptor M2-like [Lytechinus variegatus]